MNKQTSYERFHEKFIYNSETGLLINKKTHKVVGRLNHDGYLKTTVMSKSYMLHRLVYCMYYGKFPKLAIDHINRIKTDNRIKNLREISNSCNLRNAGNGKANKSGVKGVNWDKGDQRWRATIGVDSKLIHLGSFGFFINAVKARAYAEKCFNFHLYDDESPAIKYLKSVEHLNDITFKTNVELKERTKKTVSGEWEFFMTVRKIKIDKRAETYQNSLLNLV